MGGELSVESTPGLGSKFAFELAFSTISVSDEHMQNKKLMLTELEKPFFEDEILLCEDNAMNQQVISEHLTRVGIKVVIANNGQAGVEMVKSRIDKGEKQFALILMDIHMPVMDGLEAAEKILEFNTGIPIIALTANLMANDRDIYKAKGMNDCLGKPFTSQELWHCLVKYLTPLNETAVFTDIPPAMKQSDSDPELKKTLQLLFLKSNENKYDEINTAMKEGDIQLAHRLVHSLKTNAGHINKTSLQKAAANVEMRIKDGDNLVTEELLNVLNIELNEALSQISAELPLLDVQERDEVQKEPLDAVSCRELMKKLEPMLETGNPDCLKLINDLCRIPNSYDSHSLSDKLIQQISGLDFDEAIVTLRELKKMFN
jgi:CheY-like chemotaxis protein